MVRSRLSRRVFLRRGIWFAMGGVGLVLVGCGEDGDSAPTPQARDAGADDEPAPAATGSGQGQGTDEGQGQAGGALVSDVVDYAIQSDEWRGDFGFVTFRLHAALVDGEDAFFIRTDASDEAFAEEQGLVFAPLMRNALDAGQGLNAIYLFDDDSQPSVIRSAPHRKDYSPAFRVHRVAFAGTPERLESEAAIRAAAAEGRVQIEETEIVVNHPVVKWPGGALPVDEERIEYIGGGQLLAPVDVANQTVTFKLHACYPNSRYIVTDVTMPRMAEGMHIAPAPGAAVLSAAGATAKILVFANGVEGSGPMGAQKSVTDTIVGDPEWSPFWDHFTFVWLNEEGAMVLRDFAEIEGAEAAGQLQRYAGTPDTDPALFMVNCPVPIVSPVT